MLKSNSLKCLSKYEKTIIVMPVANEGATMNSIIEEIMALPYDNLYLYPVIDSYSKDDTENIIHSRELRQIRLGGPLNISKQIYENSYYYSRI